MVTVVDYDPRWAERFRGLRAEYLRALGRAGVQVLAVEHVGSTSVPELAAKPVIDVDIVVAGEDVAAASEVLVGLGFRPLGELGIPERWGFREPDRLAGTNTYVVIAGSLALRNHLGVRDVLRSDPGLRAEYAAVKKTAAMVAADVDDYGGRKNAIVQRILAAGGLTEQERVSIDNNPVPSHRDRPG